MKAFDGPEDLNRRVDFIRDVLRRYNAMGEQVHEYRTSRFPLCSVSPPDYGVIQTCSITQERKHTNPEKKHKSPRTFLWGDIVEARFQGKPAYHTGKVVGVWPNGTYSILYDDGSKEDGVRAVMIRPFEGRSRRKRSSVVTSDAGGAKSSARLGAKDSNSSTTTVSRVDINTANSRSSW